MTTLTTPDLVFGVILLAIVAVAAALFLRRRRTAALKDRFGHEYDHAVQTAGDRHKAEATLEERQKRVSGFEIHPLSPERRDSFVTEWRRVQALFVDDPAGAVTRAEVLLDQIMEARGYPVSDFEQRSADLSVEHGHVVEHYRTANQIAKRHARGEAGTEELRQGLIHYRALFDDLVNEPTGDDPVIEHRGGKVRDLRKEVTRRQ